MKPSPHGSLLVISISCVNLALIAGCMAILYSASNPEGRATMALVAAIALAAATAAALTWAAQLRGADHRHPHAVQPKTGVYQLVSLMQGSTVLGGLVWSVTSWSKGRDFLRALQSWSRQLAEISLDQVILPAALIALAIVLRQVLALLENGRLQRELDRAHEQVRRQTSALENASATMQAEIAERQQAVDRLAHDVLHDTLTGLPNRVLLLDRMEQAARKHLHYDPSGYSILYLDLDGFKTINDSLGYGLGDELLTVVAHRLGECVRGVDTVARLAGDEFVLLIDGEGSQESVQQAAERILAAIHKPVLLDGRRYYLSASIGVVLHAEQYPNPRDVLRAADLALYQAKQRGKSRYEIYDASMHERIYDRMELETELRHALENNEFVLHYQPIVALADQRLVGFEALVRWQHPERGLIQPGRFIPLAEETGLILPLGRWVLWQACRQAAEWREQRAGGGHPLRVSVNISGMQLQQPGFAAQVAQALAETGLPGDWLALEVTESVCMHNSAALLDTLAALKLLGVEMQIDDFGTGYSSLSYLHTLPINIIKIDKSFVDALHSGSRSPEILRAILTIAGDLGIRTVAEGIENETQARALADLHCEYAQGFWLARPMEAGRASSWAAEQAAQAQHGEQPRRNSHLTSCAATV